MKEIAAALCKFQASISNVPFDAQNPHFKNKYASLAGILDHIRKPMSECGLCVSQSVMRDSVTTVLLHVSGENLMAETAILCSQPNNPQAYGSAITYSRRYALSAILGIAADDDDDAQTAVKPTTPPKQNNPLPAPPAAPKPAISQQAKLMFALSNECGWSTETLKGYISAQTGKASSKDLTPQEISKIIDHLQLIKEAKQ